MYVKDVLMLSENQFVLVMAALGLGSTVTALLLSCATGRYQSSAKEPSELYGRRHRRTEHTLLTGGALLGLILLPGVQ